MPDGSKGINAWKKVYDNWYYFDQNGNMTKGWQFINGLWYYMDSRGVMKTGWVNPSGNNWFFLSDSGEMLTGWVQPGPLDWYYMDGSGYMQRGWILSMEDGIISEQMARCKEAGFILTVSGTI